MSNTAKTPRPLHLQTIESIFAELIGGEGVTTGDNGDEFKLSSADSRAILNWYRLNQTKWSGNVMAGDVDAIVNSTLGVTPTLAVPEVGASLQKRKLRLTKLVAHRFAGLHNYGTENEAPKDFVFEPREPITLFEGWNGAGKTSLLNAIIWCLTGEILRPQRPPEKSTQEFESHFTRTTSGKAEITRHELTPITPLPNPGKYLPPLGKPIPADSWVELTFVDQDGNQLPPVRRTQVRNSKGKITETESASSSLNVDPVSLKIGTTMPALLPFLRMGTSSDLGLAIAKLTGLAEIANLAKHAAKVREKLLGEFRKDREREMQTIDATFLQGRNDLQKRIEEFPEMSTGAELPVPSASPDLELQLQSLERHFGALKESALMSAQSILGAEFDPADKNQRDGLEKSIGPAQGQIQSLGQLTSARRIQALLGITSAEWDAIERLITQMRTEAAALDELTKNPEIGRRKQLYARVSEWIAEAGGHDFSKCDVCNRSLDGVLDPVTNRSVSQHLAEITKADQDLLSLTHQKWCAHWEGVFGTKSPPALQSELSLDLPSEPVKLIRMTLVDELFGTESFKSTLKALRAPIALLCDEKLKSLSAFVEPRIEIPPVSVVPTPARLITILRRIARARAFVVWRTENDTQVEAAIKAVLYDKEIGSDDVHREPSLGIKLDQLSAIVKGVAPINAALECCGRIKAQLTLRRANESKLALYERGAAALDPIINLGTLAEAQVDTLRKLLHKRASYWRSRCYTNAYATAGHALRDTSMDAKGVLEIRVGSEKANAPAQHISNTSALRASLMGFFLAFWEHVLNTRGGLTLLIFDDPQEFLDHDNRDRLARLLPDLAGKGAQLIVATYDRHFARATAAAGRRYASIEHRSVHPINPGRSTLETASAKEDLDLKRAAYEADKDNAGLAQDYASEARIFLEARLADSFDDAAYPAYSWDTKASTLTNYINRLRNLSNNPPNALFRGKNVKDFCTSRALAQDSDCLRVLNQSHHDKQSLTAGEVFNVVDDIARVCHLGENMHSEFRHWRWHEPLQDPVTVNNVVPFKAVTLQPLKVAICPDLAAFTSQSATGPTQDIGSDWLTESWFVDKTLFYVRVDNLGFAIPSGCIAIAESTPYQGRDHNLVIARQGKNTLIRRLFCPNGSNELILAAEPPDPRSSKPTLVFIQGDVVLHKIVGFLTERPAPTYGKGEAVEISSPRSLSQIKAAYRVREESGIPMALPDQIVIGGDEILPSQLTSLEGELIALTLEDGGGFLKRIGRIVPGSNGRLRQFESVGGLGSSMVVSIDATERIGETLTFASARRVLGVLYSG